MLIKVSSSDTVRLRGHVQQVFNGGHPIHAHARAPVPPTLDGRNAGSPFTGTAVALTAQHFATVVTLAARFSFGVKLTVALSTEP